MTLVVIGLVIIAFVVGWKWGDTVALGLWELLKAAALGIAELAKKLWAKIFKKS